ncbi:hypothetical protein B005_5036 [Nocardiopsis alba ATCC BAA-2165]|uniref:Uncharacterized protein n=1 Tax=Nocardiopsis alba (strain ATCC BAA-2165 / BE74) TaxID=1205910 RepID=J7LHQ4_NOCAA|nr:hypothetical protein B005_5036 [Nocardiopsis alba ATCC BAA-2165]
MRRSGPTGHRNLLRYVPASGEAHGHRVSERIYPEVARATTKRRSTTS